MHLVAFVCPSVRLSVCLFTLSQKWKEQRRIIISSRSLSVCRLSRADAVDRLLMIMHVIRWGDEFEFFPFCKMKLLVYMLVIRLGDECGIFTGIIIVHVHVIYLELVENTGWPTHPTLYLRICDKKICTFFPFLFAWAFFFQPTHPPQSCIFFWRKLKKNVPFIGRPLNNTEYSTISWIPYHLYGVLLILHILY